MYGKPSRFTVKTGKAKSSVSILNAVDKAMIDASIGDFNIIEVSSVLPEDIERVDHIESNKGEFKPAVMSKVTGSGKEMIAGLGWGIASTGGGYIIEHYKSGDNLKTEQFNKEIKEKLQEMADCRDIKFKKSNFVYEDIEVNEDDYGCVMAVLVFQS